MEPDKHETHEAVLLRLFRIELMRLTDILSSGLTGVQETISRYTADVMIRAVCTIRGSARVVGLPSAVRLAYAMEKLLTDVRAETFRLMPVHMDRLCGALAIFQTIQEQQEEKIRRWVSEHEALIARMTEILQHDASGEETIFTMVQTEAESDDVITSPPVESNIMDKQDEEYSPSGMPDRKAEPTNPSADINAMCAGDKQLVGRNLRDLDPGLWNAITESADETYPSIPTVRGRVDNTPLDQKRKTSPGETVSYRPEMPAGKGINHHAIGEDVPFLDRIEGIRREVGELEISLRKVVQFRFEGDATGVDPTIAAKLAQVLLLLVRGLMVYSLETPEERKVVGKSPEGHLSLAITSREGKLRIALTDDGRGMPKEDIKKLSGIPGIGDKQGVACNEDVIDTLVESLDGTIYWGEESGEGTHVILHIPAVTFLLNCFLVSIGGESYALPIARIEHLGGISLGKQRQTKGQRFYSLDGDNIPLVDAGELFKVRKALLNRPEASVVFIRKGQCIYGLIVDALLGEERLVLQPLDPRLGKVNFFRATAIRADGTPTLVLDADDVLNAVEQERGGEQTGKQEINAGKSDGEETDPRPVE